MRVRRPPSIFAALAAACVLVAGGATGIALASPAGPSPIEQAAAKTAKAGSFRLSFNLSIAVKGGSAAATLPGPISLTGQGAFDTRHSTGQFSLNLGSLAAALGGTTGTSVPSTIDLILLKTALYVHFPALAKQVSPGKEWLKFDASKLPKSATGGTDVGQVAQQVNPQQALSTLRGAVSVHRVGSDRIRGVSTTHYKAVLDLTKMVSALPKSQQASALKGIRQAGLTKLPLDAWIDGSSYLRRFAVSTHVKSQGTAVALKLSLDLYDYGAKLHVSAPPAAQVADGTALLNGIIASTGGGSGKTPPKK